MKRTLREQETILLYNNGDPQVEIYTYDPKLKRKIEQAAERRPELYRITQREPDGALRCVFPKKWLTIVLREPISEAERQRRSERGKANDMAALLRQQRR